jgi:RimJ/RimL family protein N-acetyltransferase
VGGFERALSDVRLEPWSEADLDLLRGLVGDPAMMEHLGGPETEAKVAERHGRYVERARAEGSRRFVYAFPSVGNPASNALCRRLGFELQGEDEFEFPPGQLMRCNDWRFDLGG